MPELELIVAAYLAMGLVFYALLGGADFGAGVWEFNTALWSSDEESDKESAKESDFIHKALGPVWEANHVWLIFVFVILWSAFPIAFAAASRALWLPLMLALAGIVFRGAAFAFRAGSIGAPEQRRIWNALFALGSAAAPFFLGAAGGALASGSLPIRADGGFDGNYLSSWITPLALYAGFFCVAACSYLAALYLAREADLQGLDAARELWRRRSLATGAWVGALALAGLPMMATSAPTLWEGFAGRAWPLAFASMAGGFASLWATWRRAHRAAIGGAAVAVGAVLAGWALAQYPMLAPPTISIYNAHAPEAMLRAVVWIVPLGMAMVAPSLWLLFSLFKSAPPRA